MDGPVELGEQAERLLSVSGDDAVANGHDARRVEDVGFGDVVATVPLSSDGDGDLRVRRLIPSGDAGQRDAGPLPVAVAVEGDARPVRGECDV